MSEHYDIICPECKKRIGGCRCIGEPRTQQVADRPCEVCQAVKHLASTPTGDPQPGRFSMWVALSDVYGCTGTRNSEPTPEAIAEVEADGRRWIYMVESQGAPSPAPAGDWKGPSLLDMKGIAKACPSEPDWDDRGSTQHQHPELKEKLRRLLDYLADEVDYEENAHLNAAILARQTFQEMQAPASPGTVQAPAAGPRVCNNGKVKVVFEGKAFHAVCSCGFRGPAAQLFGEALDGVWVKAHPGAGAPSAGRPMTWTREAVALLRRFVEETECYCADNVPAGNGVCPVHEAEALLAKIPAPEDERSESVRPEAEPAPESIPICDHGKSFDEFCDKCQKGEGQAPTPASGDTAPTETQKELEQFRKESPIFDALMIELRGSWPQYEHYARLLNEARGFRAPIREAKAPADEDPTEGGKYVYCHGCSEAGGAGRAIYHLPPACGEAKADPGQGTGEG